MTIDKTISYTAADTIPLKMIVHNELQKSIKEGVIIPIHVQFIPTNKCNLSCNFCSCSKRTKNLEMDFDKAKKVIDDLAKLGCKAVTITGGGEPLMYPKINELIEYFISKKIKVGFVTNGLMLKSKMNMVTLNKVTWCRVSNGDDRTLTGLYRDALSEVVKKCPDVDWAFSHVVTVDRNFEEIRRIIEFANMHNFTHVRLVADLFSPEQVSMDAIKEHMRLHKIDDTKVIYQGRKEFERGGDCFICYLKPLIGPDFVVYNCCGVQYAMDNPAYDLPIKLSIGYALNLQEIYNKNQKAFNGSICSKCYYMNYNRILKSMLSEINHADFV